ncbi:hypothetical protein BCR33DRAFT_714841 [Rhizoclosmatium globosum]|uniref:Crinkler (CRN) family protein n=1 Tax=Rhizoclosmatium globosum TaxID=329046 RepID=A0A1Y2CLB8_9FUNG|nr:hypothetical protein BCR33DRAFT_714841 [Rhizoclosmatium globosum]|eukprot:ORY47776.1 hypothetical protein BCR33DRAFT_714841 [Rhizoclosmatium globosum]
MTRIRCAIGCDPQLATLSVDIDTSIEVEDLKVAIHLKAAPQLNRWGPQELLLVRVVNADIGGLIKHQLIACMSILHFGTFGAFPEDAIEKDELQQFESLQGAFRELSGFHFKAMNSSTVVSEYTQNLTPSLHHIVVLTPSVPPNYTLSMSDNYVNESLESFWKSLPSLEPPNEMLRFTSIPPFFPPDMTALYIRESYFLLFERIKNTLDPVFDSRKIRMAITGNPGTGKSIFLFYILWRLSKMDKNRASSVILHRAKDNGILYIFGPTHCWRSVNETDIIPLLDIPTTWYLTDTLTPCPGEVNAVTILVSSPARKHYSTFLTFGATDSLRCLPVWSLDELQKAAALFPKLNPTDVEARYSVIGGIPRFVLEESDEDI